MSEQSSQCDDDGHCPSLHLARTMYGQERQAGCMCNILCSKCVTLENADQDIYNNRRLGRQCGTQRMYGG